MFHLSLFAPFNLRQAVSREYSTSLSIALRNRRVAIHRMLNATNRPVRTGVELLAEARETARRKALAGSRAGGEAGDWRAVR